MADFFELADVRRQRQDAFDDHPTILCPTLAELQVRREVPWRGSQCL